MNGILAMAMPLLAAVTIVGHRFAIGPAPEDHDAVPPCIGRKLAYFVFLSGFLGLGGTGAIALISGGALGGWLLWIHLLLAPAFIGGLLGVLLLAGHWYSRKREGAPEGVAGTMQRLLFWVMSLLAWISLGSILACMVSYVPSLAQPELIGIHRAAGLALLFVVPVQAYALFRAR